MHNGIQDILMAEDSSNDAELALEALAENNLANRVVVVTNGVEALDFLYRRGGFSGRTGPNPIVILLDIKMPKLNGLEVLRVLKGDSQLADIPVVMMSSSREEPDLKEARRLGAKAYVVKPVDFHEFVNAIRTVGKFWAVLNILAPAPSEAGVTESEVDAGPSFPEIELPPD